MSIKKTTDLHKKQMKETEHLINNRDARIDELYNLALEREEILADAGFKAVITNKQDIEDEALAEYDRELIEKARKDKEDIEKLVAKEIDDLMKKTMGR
jgi:transcription termination factor NusB|tara:strand:- start:3858 stop:4154 length:297 start_codon:yes stop_codon:yes gene_type:complete